MRPPSFTLSLRALFTLPYRLCNPPPAAGNVRSCKVTPLIKVTLDDVLNKRHLPPLTLKDFEEWLVFVEGTPQYLYFILWLKEYESRYAAWLSSSGCELPTSPSKFPSTTTLATAPPPPPSPLNFSYINLIPSSPPLALFFTRAKQTFLDPDPAADSPYALGPAALMALTPSTHSLTPSIPEFTVPLPLPDERNTSDIGLPAALATQPHPHPRELAPLAAYARKALKESLARFAETACHNVGTRRAWCGIAGGTFLLLVLGVVPALAALLLARERWWRVVGWLGCWLGGTIVVSSFHGICMMIYVFGDLRQLRSFELARPSISSPRAIARARPRLKSFFTRTPDASTEQSGTEGTGTGFTTGSGSTPHDSDSAEPRTPASAAYPTPSLINPSPKPRSPTNPSPKPRARPPVLPPVIIPHKDEYKDAWSDASETSTGTPVVHFGPDAFRFGVGTGTGESDATDEMVFAERWGEFGESAVGESVDVDVVGVDVGSAQFGTRDGDGGAESGDGDGDGDGTTDDFGIEISPAYYYPGPGPEAKARAESMRESVRSGGSRRSRMGRVMKWVMGKRMSIGVMSGGAVMSEKAGMANEKAQAQSHVGTFGIRSWRGGLGSLPEHSGGAGDLEKGVDAGNGNQPGLEEENMLTAEFIRHDYPEVEEKAERVSSPVSSPVKFDFDKLPAARRMSTPTSAPTSILDSERAVSPPLHAPPPVLYAHPGARLAPPPPPPPPPPVRFGAMKTLPAAKDRQWWDTCPRHPAVEATLAKQTRPPSLTIQTGPSSLTFQTQTLSRPASLMIQTQTQTCPSSLAPPSADPGSTRATSPSSSDVHSRVRVRGASPAPALYAFPSALTRVKSQSWTRLHATSGTWRTRFRRVTAVPAFGPLTRVLEPVVSRGQWEIVVRSAVAAAFGAWVVIGCLVALPEIR